MVHLGRYERGQKEVIYLFSSGSRRLYEEDVFNTLAYPPGFIIQFRYREPWVGPRIQNADDLEGCEAVVVSCPRVFRTQDQDLDEGEKEHCGYNYYPLRRGTIVRSNERGGAVHVYCKLGPDLVKYPKKNEWNQEKTLSNPVGLSNLNYRTYRSHPGSHILHLRNRPRMGVEDDDDDVFISKGPDLGIPTNDRGHSPEERWVSQEDYWVRLVEFVADDPFFKQNLFYRITEVKSNSNTLGYQLRHPIRSLFWNRSSTENIFTDTISGYKIDSGGQYRLNLSLAFAGPPPKEARKDSLILNTPQLIDTFPAEFNLGFRTDERSVIVDPSSVEKKNYSAIEINVNNREDSYTAPHLDLKFKLYPTFTRRVGVPILLIFGVLVVIASGSVSEPLSNFVTQQFSSIAIDDGAVNLLLTLMGLTMTTIGFQLRDS